MVLLVFFVKEGRLQNMFDVGDRIIYGSSGVCSVEHIGALDSPNALKGRIYYTLCPQYTKGSTIFTPVDNEKVKMRPVISREEAMKLVDEVKDIEYLWIADEKGRELEYKEAFLKCDCRELVRIIKTIYLRKQSRIVAGKKVTAVDEKYFHMAEDSLYGELAVSLNMTKDEVRDFITSRVEQQSIQE